MKKAVVLARRSLDDEEAETTLGRQSRNGVAWCESAGLEVVEVISELGSAYRRSMEERTDLSRALSLLRRGDADVLVVERVDRLTRRGSGELLTLIEEMQALGRRIYFLDISGYGDEERTRVVLSLLGEMARSEAVSISTRQKASIKDRKARGLHAAGRAAMFYESDGQGQLRLADRAAARELVEMILQGISWRQISMQKDIPISTLRQWASNPLIAGWASVDNQPLVIDGDFVSCVSDEPLVTAAEFKEIQDRFDLPGRPKGRPTRALLRGGRVETPDGRKMVPSGKYYRCRPTKDGDLRGYGVYMDEFDEYVAGRVTFRLAGLEDNYPGPERDYLESVAALFEGPDENAVERARLTNEIADIQTRLQDVEDGRYLRGDLPHDTYERLSGQLREGLKKANDGLAALPASRVDTNVIRSAVIQWPKWTQEAKVALLSHVLEKVIIDYPPGSLDARVELVWRDLVGDPEASGAP